MGYQAAFIRTAIAYQALRFGEFTLKSGRISPYFFNVGHLNTGEALNALGEAYAQTIQDANIPYDVLFGPAYKGIPLVCTTAISLSNLHQQSLPYCFNRKEAKNHGEQGLLIGAPLSGRVMILDDVITAGTAIREAFLLIQNHQATVAGIIVALDRQEKGQGDLSAIQEIESLFQVPIRAIITLDDIMQFVAKDPAIASYLPALQAYRAQYGVNA